MLDALARSIIDIDILKRDQAWLMMKHAGRVIFIGNGGSASIASHMAVDFTKNARITAIAFNDAPTLTCVANDYGYEDVFSIQLGWYGRHKDAVVLISSSGRSPNILSAAHKARDMKLGLITLTGFDADNPLRTLGDINFWVDSHDYGVVEITHLAILHSIIHKEEQWRLSTN